MRKTHKNMSKTGLIFIILLFSLASISISYSGFTDILQIHGGVTIAEDFYFLELKSVLYLRCFPAIQYDKGTQPTDSG